MATYKPNASTFEDWDKEFTPSQEHFAEWDKESAPENFKMTDNVSLKGANPIIYGLAEKLAENPNAASAVQGIAESPGVEAALSAGPALVNAFGNVANLPTEITTGNKIVPKMQRPFPEPTDTRGKIGSAIGNVAGAGIGFAASPGSMTIPGGLATGFAQGEGGILPRSLDALVGLLLPGLLHGGKFAKSALKSREASKEISKLGLEKADAERSVFGAKEALADKLSKEVAPIKDNIESLKGALDRAAGSSESVAKQSVANLTQKAEKDITKKYNRLYEGFNAGEGGQSLVKEPIQIDTLAKEYGLTPNDFSSDSKKLIENLVGKSVSKPEGKILSASTGKPINQASISLEQAKPAKVVDYINLWKQLRSEVAEYRHSGKMAQTPEAKRTFRDKANQLEKLSDDINSKAMGSLSKGQQKEYSAIQQGYLNERVPFLEKPLLKNAADRFGEVPDNYFDKLNKSGVPDLLKTFQKEHPELVQAITTHDLRNVSKLNSGQLKELIDSDFGKFIPKNVKDTMKGLHLHKSAHELLTKALGKVQASEIGRKVKSSDISDIIKKRPDLAKPFSNVSKEQERLRKLKDALVDAGFKLKDAQEQLAKYKKVGSFAKMAGTPVAAYAGILKAKGSGVMDTDE